MPAVHGVGLSLKLMKQIALLACFCLCVAGLHAQSSSRVFTLSQFVLEDSSGHEFNLDSLKGKTVYVDCWFPSCPPCRKEMPYSRLLQQRLHTAALDSNIVFVTICFLQSKEAWIEALHELPVPEGIHLYAPAGKYSGTFVTEGYPTYRIFNSKGELEVNEAPRPSEWVVADFIIYAVANGLTVKEATMLEWNDKRKDFSEKHIAAISQPVRKNFFTRFAPFEKTFMQEYMALRKK